MKEAVQSEGPIDMDIPAYRSHEDAAGAMGEGRRAPGCRGLSYLIARGPPILSGGELHVASRLIPVDFPYERLREGQDLLIGSLVSFLSGGERELVIEAYNGIGKTVSLLYALKKLGMRAVVAVKTYEELRNYIEEGSKLGLTVSPILSKRSFCLNEDVARLPDDRFYRKCRELVDKGLCKYARQQGGVPGGIEVGPDLQGLVEELVRKEVCPYYFSLKNAYRGSVIVATYPFLFNPAISPPFRDMYRAWFENLVIDEAHNIAFMLLSSLKVYDAQALYALAYGHQGRERYAIRMLADMLSGKRRHPHVTIEDLAWEVAPILGVDRVVVKGRRLIAFEPMTIPKGGGKTVLMSGYIPQTVLNLFRRGRFVRIEAPESLKVTVYVAEDVTSRYEERERNVERFRRYVKEFKRLGGRKAIFFASERLMAMVMGRVEKPPRIFRPEGGEYTICDVVGGRLSEGSNVPMEKILIVGMPFLEPTDELREFMRHVEAEHGREFAWTLYEDLGLCRLVQTLGRLTRMHGRRPYAVVLDSRLLDYRERLPSWVEVEPLNRPIGELG